MVQVSRLPARRRNDLEKLLSVFDQDLRAADSRHALELDAATMPARYAPVLRRLQLATASPELRHAMLTEDEIVDAWERVHRKHREQQEAIAEQQETIANNRTAIAEQQEALAKQQMALAARHRTIETQRAEIEALRRRLGDEA